MLPEGVRGRRQGLRPDHARGRGRLPRRSASGGSAWSSRTSSPRRVDAATAAVVLAAVPAGVARVGVFVGASAAEMARTARRVGLTHLQVHGDADPDEARRVSGLPVIQGIGVRDEASLERARASAADLVLLDAAVAGLHGGTGTVFDWSLLEGGALGRPFALAGGLRPENVADAVTAPAPRDRGRLERRRERRPGARTPSACAPSSTPSPRSARCGRMSDPRAADGELAARFGDFGGRFVPETVIGALDELERGLPALPRRRGLPGRARGPARPLRRPADAALPGPRARGAPTASSGSTSSARTSATPGAHKINNALGQVLLASKMGKRRIIAETGAGQHGVATATAAALLGPRVLRLHGPRGHGPPAPERDPHAHAGRRGAPGRLGHRHPQGRAQRGDPRLGDQRARDPLRHRDGRRAGALPGDRRRAAVA